MMLREDLSLGAYANNAFQASPAELNSFQQGLLMAPRQSNEKVVGYVTLGVYCLDIGLVVFCRRRDFSRNYTKDAAAAPRLALQHQSNLLERSFCSRRRAFSRSPATAKPRLKCTTLCSGCCTSKTCTIQPASRSSTRTVAITSSWQTRKISPYPSFAWFM